MEEKILKYVESMDFEEVNQFIVNTKSNISASTDIKRVISDTSWVDMIEEAIPYLDNIIRNPRRFIMQEENIVPIEKAKVVTEESIRHLAQNTNLIQDVEKDGTVIPLKLLNVYREETVDLYENRFIKSLVDNLYQFVNDKLKESDQKSYARVTNKVSFNAENKNKKANTIINVSMQSVVDEELDNGSKDGHSFETRIEHIKDVLAAFKSSQFIKSLAASQPVRSPIRKTNVILKEQNFIKAVELWEYLEKNAIKPITSVEEQHLERGKEVKDKFDLAFFIQNDALKMSNNTADYKNNTAALSKIINDIVYGNDLNETEFKALVVKEFKNANKKKKKQEIEIKKAFDNFFEDYAKRKQKACDLLK